jgi:hypothetical protein
MEAEYVALRQAIRDLIPIFEMINEIMRFIFVQESAIKYRTHSKNFQEIHLNSEIVQKQIIFRSV